MEKNLSFEDNIEFINKEIRKRKGEWTLTALSWMDFDDISQILRIHIYKKWSLYDQKKPLGPWINTIITNQIKNLIRNNYGNYSRPCLKCAASEGEDLCNIYTKQCNSCPLYAHWEKNKKQAYDIKLPVTIENHTNEISEMTSEAIDIDLNANNIHEYMQKNLKPLELKIYNYLYVEHKTEIEVAKLMGYKTNEKGRSPGYKQIKNIKKNIIIKVKKALIDGEIEIIKYG